MEIVQASTPEHLEAARNLFQEYAAWLQVDLCFQNFEAELAGLPGAYAPPHGRLLLGRNGDTAEGCVALRPVDARVCEMKRLYVRPSAQGHGLGRKLADRVIAEARQIGYSCMVLDTLPFMSAAQRLYEQLGFVRRTAYYATPLQETIFMELKL